MACYTKEERELLVKNVKAVLNYVKNEISPFLREFEILKFEDHPRHYPIMFIVDPGKNPEIKFTRGSSSTQYYINDEFDSESTKSNRRYYRWFFESYPEMHAFLENWQNMKRQLLNKIEANKSIKYNLKNFQV
jgi:hypothetical protein